jgi:hypothetical protein
MACLEYRRRGKVRGPVDYVCLDLDDRCRYMGGLVNDGRHQYEDGECIVCADPEPS